MKENSIKNERSSIEEDIKIALDKFSNNKDIDSAILIVEKFILGNYILLGGRGNIVKDSLQHILSDYRRLLKENEILKKEKEQAWEEWNNLEQGSYETEQKLKQQIKESQRENEELRAKWNKDTHILQNELDLTNADKINNYIPVQKVKDKIEEIVEKIKHEENEKVVIYLSKQKNILQQLLESDE